MSFNEFLKEQHSEVGVQEELKRQRLITTFQERVNQLYSDIEHEWLKDYIAQGQLSISRQPISVTEEKLGEYHIDELRIKIASKEVSLMPRGTIMIGTDARVDVLYLGIVRAMLVRAGEHVDNPVQMINVTFGGEKPKKKVAEAIMEWKIVKNENRRKLIKLSHESFEDMLMGVLQNG